MPDRFTVVGAMIGADFFARGDVVTEGQLTATGAGLGRPLALGSVRPATEPEAALWDEGQAEIAAVSTGNPLEDLAERQRLQARLRTAVIALFYQGRHVQTFERLLTEGGAACEEARNLFLQFVAARERVAEARRAGLPADRDRDDATALLGLIGPAGERGMGAARGLQAMADRLTDGDRRRVIDLAGKIAAMLAEVEVATLCCDEGRGPFAYVPPHSIN